MNLTDEEIEALLILLDITNLNKIKEEIGYNNLRILKELQKKETKYELND